MLRRQKLLNRHWGQGVEGLEQLTSLDMDHNLVVILPAEVRTAWRAPACLAARRTATPR